ncbi:MAG TPA: alanine dehydrogenase [Xanthobacteraceae bacterium]|nr:alanine dehydrogenase [Xanthobacteraceae bacterium]
MKVGIPKEIKDNEYRVGLVPSTVRELTARGHRVLVETSAGAGAGISDDEYRVAGAEIVSNAEQVFTQAELIVKVKEPLARERSRLRSGQVLFTYLHLAADAELTKDLMASGVTAIAYETVTGPGRTLPLLKPMSEVAGRMAPQVGAHHLERPQGGRGVLLGGVEGVAPAKVFIIGTGVVGLNAALIAAGMKAEVTLAARPDSLETAAKRFGREVHVIPSTPQTIESTCAEADLVIGAALVPGAAAPKLISKSVIGKMKTGSVIVDVSIDQGGNAETSRPTTHSAPTFVVDGVIHYCVANMPGAVPRTSTFALNAATRPFVLALADKGYRRALAEDPDFRNGLNISAGKLTCRAVAEALNLAYTPAEQVIAGGAA